MVEMKKINLKELILPDYNPRHITDEAFESLKRSITEFGYVTPIVVNTVNNHVIGGNQRVKALIECGYEVVECAIVEIHDINEEKALNIRLNNNSGDWDIEKLDNIFNDLELSGFDATLTGFNTENLQPFESSETTTEIPTNETITSNIPIKNETTIEKGINRTDPDYKEPTHDIKEDTYKDENITVNVKTGDLYRLGNHYLYCGDSLKTESYTILCQGQEMDLCFTDPPYGMKKEKKGVHNDNLNYDKLLEFNKKWIPLALKSLKDVGSIYIWGIDEPLMDIHVNIMKPLIKNQELTFRNLLTWDKGNGQGQLSSEFRSYARADEKCLFYMKGVQGFNTNSDNYYEGWEPIRQYLLQSRLAMGWDVPTMKTIVGHSDKSRDHWTSKSQFSLIPEYAYKKLQEEAERQRRVQKSDNDAFKKEYDAFKKEYDAFKKEYDAFKKEYYKTRAYFNNTHDNMNNVWHIKRAIETDQLPDKIHATPKPIELCTRGILSSSRVHENVIDVFGGSGSTLIACEQTDRNCYMMEIDPYYCQIIINRWEDFTSETAVKIN